MLKELGLDYARDSEGDFTLDSKEGEVHITINDSGDLVTTHLSIGVIENNPRKKGDFYSFLLRMNTYTSAKFCFLGDQDDKEWHLSVLARSNAETLDAGDLEWDLHSVLQLSSVFSDDDDGDSSPGASQPPWVQS